MSRSLAVRVVVALGVVAFSLYLALTQSPRLGIDLRGGTQIVLETQDSATREADAESTDRALEVLRQRVDALGVTEPTLVRSGDRRIIVELPEVHDPREAAKVLGKTAQLTFHPVLGIPGPDQRKKNLPEGQRILPDEDGQPILLGATAMTGEGVDDAQAVTDEVGRYLVTIDFRGQGADTWANLTGEAACFPNPADPRRRVAIVLDGAVISSPSVQTSVPCDVGINGGSTEITGDFSPTEAKDLAVLIKGGALPLPVEVIEQRTTGATLGDEAIAASKEAAVIGLILTGVFIVLVYRLMGALATVALASYALISYAMLLALGATLTLPGLAGFVLAIGIAIDANVLVFERAREEFAEGSRGLRASLQSGFKHAWSAILDSNVTTLLAAGLLFFLAAGPVKGFGVTLSIGVLASMVSALVIARALTEYAAGQPLVTARPGASGLASLGRVRVWLRDRAPDIMGRSGRWLAVSAVAVVLAGVGIGVKGLDLGVEFTGGRQLVFSTAEPVDVDNARAAVSDAGFPTAVVQESGEDDISVRTAKLTNDEAVAIEEAIGDVAGGATKQSDELIGPSLGDELRTKALIALGVALAAQMLYLAVRFRWIFSVSAVAAMAHDVLIVVGVFAWLGKPIDGVFLAAVLTIIGLSVNDSVVVFDRIRERWNARSGDSFARIANTAVLETVPRTVNTGLGAMFILAALTLLGGDSLTDFALALLLGLLIGTYSSVFAATPLAVILQRSSGAEPPQQRAERTKRGGRVNPYGTSASDDSGAVL